MIAPWMAALPWLVGPAAVLWRLRDSRFLHDYAPADASTAPRVSVIIPARNEAHNIARCVSSLGATSLRDVEIIVVDDHSTDDTAGIAREAAGGDARVRITTPPPLPGGWFGKQWACAHGASVATGSLLLFTDADTWHAPELLARAVTALHERGADLFSVAGQQETVSFWEKVVQPVVFIGLFSWFGGMEQISRATEPRRKIANGQFILVRRAVYDAEGGHQAVRGYVAEDLMLAQQWTRAGRAVHMVVGLDLLRTRMYRSLPDLIQGWGKNAWAGGRHLFADAKWWPLLRVLMPLGPLLGLLPVLLMVLGISGVLPPYAAQMGGYAFLFQTTVWMALYTYVQMAPRYAVLYPLGCVIAMYIFAKAAWRGEQTEWKGRKYASQ